MGKYRKRPVVIDAFQADEAMDIETLEGVMHASAGDYIITGVNGERYPCKPDIFAKTYEPADEQPTVDAVPVTVCAKCKYNRRCMFQSFVIDNGSYYDENTFFCADGERR